MKILKRAVRYAAQTKRAHLLFSHDAMQSYTPPKTIRKPTDTDNPAYETMDNNVTDGIPQADDETTAQEYTYKGTGEHVIQTCMTDIDLAGQIETRQSISGTMHYLNGVLVHWRGKTERLIVHTTAAGEYIALAKQRKCNSKVNIQQSGSRTHRNPTKHERPQPINRHKDTRHQTRLP
jgi:hypothetical protein